LNKLSLFVRTGRTTIVLSVPKENSQIEEKCSNICSVGIKKPQTVDSRCAKMIQNPAISAKNTASGQRAKTGFFIAILII